MRGLIHSQLFVLSFIGFHGRLRSVIPLLRRRNRRKCSVRLLWWLAFQQVLARPGAATARGRLAGGEGVAFRLAARTPRGIVA